MLKFSANLGFLFVELPLLERFAAARQAGFVAVEIMGPERATADEIAAAAACAQVEVVLCNAPVGDFVAGGLGLSGVPGRQDDFRVAVRWVADFARVLNCRAVNIGPSRIPSEADRGPGLDVMAENLRFAGDVLGDCGIRVLVEPLNSHDIGGVLLRDVGEAVAVIRASNHPNVSLQFDLYHMHQMHDDALAELEAVFDQVGHVQFADVPGRGAPGTGEVDFAAFFGALERRGYSGWLGAEYRASEPRHRTMEWIAQYVPQVERPARRVS